jgi:hypothetical protein
VSDSTGEGKSALISAASLFLYYVFGSSQSSAARSMDTKPWRVVDFGKLPHIDYSTQVELLAPKVGRYGNPRALVDAGAADAAVVELMRTAGMNIEEFRFTQNSKARIVTSLAVSFEQRQVVLPMWVGRSKRIGRFRIWKLNFSTSNLPCCIRGRCVTRPPALTTTI